MFWNNKKNRIKLGFSEDIEPQDILLDSLAQKKEEELGISEKKFEVPVLKMAIKGLWGFSIFILLLLFAKTFQLQVLEHEKYSAMAEDNKFIITQIKSERGVIYDKDMKQLAFNKFSFDLICLKKDIPQEESEKQRVFNEVSRILKINPEELKSKIEKNKEKDVLVSANMGHQDLIILETKIQELPGFEIRNNETREYKDGPIFSHLMGYLGKITPEELKTQNGYSMADWIGKDGVEKEYEEILKKKSGEKRTERDVMGNIISEETISVAESGDNLVLWLDSGLQEKIAEELKKGIEQVGSKMGVAVAMNPKTGGILSLVNIPSFDNNLFSKGADPKKLKELLSDKDYPLFNRVISGNYAVGSTIKPLVATAALEEKIISPNKNINCQGLIEIVSKYDPENIQYFRDWATHGPTNMRKAIAESCNVYFYTIGGGYGNQSGLGPTRIKKFLELFGWGKETNVDLPGERKGLMPSPEWKKTNKRMVWTDGDTYNFSIGQGYLLATPIQVVTAISAVANGGKLLQPQTVKAIIDSDKKIIKEYEPKIIRENFVNPESLKIVKEGMREGVIYGSSALMNSLPVEVAAKTGTAQIPIEGHYNNWVSVFAPYDDPQIVLTLMVEDVRGMQAVAVPIANEILKWYFTQDKPLNK